MTPEQRYTKARSIPPSEWDWLRDYPVELNNIRFYDGEIRIDTQHGGEILISPDDVDANTVEKLVIESFIDHYAPEVELVWEEIPCVEFMFRSIDSTGLFYIEGVKCADGRRIYWQWWLCSANKTILKTNEIDGVDQEIAISAAKAAAGELIKSVIKKP